MLDQQIKIKSLSDEDIDAYVSASEGNPGLKDLSQVSFEEKTPLTNTSLDNTEIVEEDAVSDSKKKVKQLSEEDFKVFEKEFWELENGVFKKKISNEGSSQLSKAKKEILTYSIEQYNKLDQL